MNNNHGIMKEAKSAYEYTSFMDLERTRNKKVFADLIKLHL